MQSNFKIVVEYDGTKYFGWQIQKDQITIQGELQHALSKILNQKIKIIGSGRTDAGVHAYGQVANFLAETDLDCEKLKNAANSLIKNPVVIKKCVIVPDSFHARYDAVSKEYHYNILNRYDPCAINKNYVWHIKKKLNLNIMQKCCDVIKGEHDFKSFEGSGSPRNSTVRNINHAEFAINKNNISMETIVFKISANGFLKFMVRNILGTIVLAGLSKIEIHDFKNILRARDRNLAGPTAPARGLFLMNVKYPDNDHPAD